MPTSIDERINARLNSRTGSTDIETRLQERLKNLPEASTDTEERLNNRLSGNTVTVKPTELKTVEGSRTAVEQAGLDTSNIPVRGENPNEIFSGGFVMDTFDTLNALSYGVVGMMKGKGFVEGIKTRQSFSDKDALGQYGVGGMIAGTLLDIAFDPLTYVAPVTILSKLGVTGTARAGAKFVGNLPIPEMIRASKFGKNANLQKNVGEQLGTMFVYRFGQDPVYKQLAERAILAKNKAIQAAVDLVRPMAKLDPNVQRAIAGARKKGDLSLLPPEIAEKARPVFERLDLLSREAVDLGLLDEATYSETVGSYLPRLYRKFEDPSSEFAGRVKNEFFDQKKLSATSDRFKSRSDIPEEVREAMGEILEAGYPTAKGLMQLTRAVENAKFFKKAGETFGRQFDSVAEATALGYAKLPDSKRLASLSGQYVPKFIADDINDIIRASTMTEDISRPIVGAFKYAKVILNPATHVRNVMSNLVLNSFEGLPPGHPAYARAAVEVATKGKWYKEAQEFGLGIDTFAAQEIGDFLVTPQVKKLGQGVQNTMKRIADIYQKEEEFAKMAQYIFQRTSKGLSPEEAWKVAEKATFNYAQVTPFIRHMRTAIYGMPFITFTAKATPQVVETMLKKPGRVSVYGKIKEGVENQTDQEELAAERASEPSWVRNGFYMKLPAKDEYGRSMYLDLTYILPFGDLIGGNLFDREVNRETGFQEGIPATAVNQSFALNIIDELASNQDFYGNKIFKDSDPWEKQMFDLSRYLFQTMAPPLVADAVPGGYREDGTRRPTPYTRVGQVEQGNLESGGAQTRDVGQELLSRAGIKINPVDLDLQQTFSEKQELQALQTLLEEAGVTGSFEINYLRK